MGVQLIEAWGLDKKIAMAARTSTAGLDNDKGKVEGLVRRLWLDGHYSPFEHCGATFSLHVPLFVRDQIVRHSSLSFSIQSARYKEFEPVFYDAYKSGAPLAQYGDKALDYKRYEPDGNQVNYYADRSARVETVAWEAYETLLAENIAKEQARALLPASIYTSMWATGNLRSWLHFCKARLDEHTQWETRQVARQVIAILEGQYPAAVAAFNEKEQA